MGTSKRERQKQARQARIEAARRAERRSRLRQRVVGILVLIGLLVGVALVLSGNGDDTVDTTASTSTTAAADPAEPSFPDLSPPPPGASIAGETPCPADDGSAERTTAFAAPPPMCIDSAKDYAAVVETSMGPFTIDLDPSAAPLTVNNFVVLARYHYYDGVPFHRIIPGFVNQVGDATFGPDGANAGTGGPGYEFEDELPTAVEAYGVGAVAMANSGPDTNGSQFFVCLGCAGLPGPSFSLFGQVTDGLDLMGEINGLGTPSTGSPDDGRPTEIVTIDSITVTES